MAFNTAQGRAYTLDDMMKLASVGAFGQYNGAVIGLINGQKILQSQLSKKDLEIESLKSQLLEIRKEVNQAIEGKKE